MTYMPPELISYQYDERARTYDGEFATWNGPREVAKRVMKSFNKQAGLIRILDVGCGSGLLSAAVKADRPSCSVAGIDISEGMLDICRNKKIADDLKCIDFQLNSIPYEDGSFDVAASTGVFELLHNPDRVIQEMSRILKPGGLIVFSTYITGENPKYMIGDNAHTDETIRNALQVAGIVLDDVTKFACSNDQPDRTQNIYAGRKPAPV